MYTGKGQTHPHTHTNTDASMQRLACTQLAERSQHTTSDKDIWRYAACCYGAERTHTQTHAGDAVRPKETTALPHLWKQTQTRVHTRSMNPGPRKKKQSGYFARATSLLRLFLEDWVIYSCRLIRFSPRCRSPPHERLEEGEWNRLLGAGND